MAEGRIGVGPRVAAILMATVVLTGVVAASGGAFDSPSPTTSTVSTTTPAKDPPSVEVLVSCFGRATDRDRAADEAPMAVARIESAGKGDSTGLVTISLVRHPVGEGCLPNLTFCTAAVPRTILESVSKAAVEGTGWFELERPSQQLQVSRRLKLTIRQRMNGSRFKDSVIPSVKPTACLGSK